ncbi:MAG: YunG family protein, partial [Vulcanimicrobiaceae bacterium]
MLALLREACILVATGIDPDRPTPLTGWCVEVAMTVRAVFGGSLLVSDVGRDGNMHYWNRFPDGTECDLTSDQFGGDGIHPILSSAQEADIPSPLPPHILLFIEMVQ